ncbi:restriction endonuclease subunit S [Campylobacter jejuni]|nr:restriction endonuclease subunit S [Campylobacter jejuni]RTJ57515.1 restriction endonuclease subunit S [Campylobacter jejuni]
MKNFKDSGIEWLGEIPEHWKLIKCKNFFVLKSIPIGDLWNKTKLLSLTLNGVIERDINNPEGKFPSDFSTYQIVKEGDLIFCLFDVAETPRTIGLSKLNGMITSAYTIFEIKNQEKRFLEYFFIDLDNRKNLKFLYRGLRNTISKEDLLNLKIPLPPLKEQEQIANFLDEKCEQIANFIEKKEKLISLLKEQKQALINETITKGLNKNVNFKDSGIEWLGEIPQDWKVKRLRYIGYVFGGLVGKTSKDFSDEYIKGFKPYITFKNVCDNTIINFNKIEYVNINDLEKQNKVIKNDILFLQSSETLDEIGKSAIYLNDEEIYLNTFCKGFRIKNSAFPIFLNYLFNSLTYKKYFISNCSGFTRINLRQEHLLDIPLILPPLKEQEQIANFLDEKCEKIDLLIEKTEKQIKLIKEYKTTLINQAVCGRIDL